MVKKNWIVIVCCVALIAMVCAVSYAEKGGKSSIPAVVEAAVKALVPNATIVKSKLGEEKVSAYEIDVNDGSRESEVTIAEDGTAIDAEYTEAMDTVPPAVAAAIKAQNAEVKEVVRVVEYAQIKVVKLATPVTSYEAEIVKDGRKMEVEFAADGKILKQEVMKDKKEKDNDEEKGEHEDKD
jgi:uncharacterized membrane protein YkoI